LVTAIWLAGHIPCANWLAIQYRTIGANGLNKIQTWN
jgi:hypothetical protein